MAKKKAAKWFMPGWWHARQKQKALLALVRGRDGDLCWFCGHRMRFGPPYNVGKAATIEHLLAKSLGGKSDAHNLRLCHVGCNRHLGVHPPEQKERMRLKLAREKVTGLGQTA